MAPSPATAAGTALPTARNLEATATPQDSPSADRATIEKVMARSMPNQLRSTAVERNWFGILRAMTFSIVARSADGESWGVAVASKFLAVGSAVPAAVAGLGAIATQAHANVAYKGLAVAHMD